MDMTAFDRLEKWLSYHPEPRYMPVHPVPNGPTRFPIQQVRDELLAFVEVLQGEPRHQAALEIGMGRGSTFYLWRLLYKTAATIEHDRYLIGFFEGLAIARPQCLEGIAPGTMFECDSGDKRTTIAVRERFPDGFDMLFIDGDHRYSSVRIDHEFYSPMVNEGGIVAFHDALSMDTGVPDYLREIAISHTLHNIFKSDTAGIAWYRKEAAI